MKILQGAVVIIYLVSSFAQQHQDDYPDYQDYADSYQQDNLYADYATRQDIKADPGAGGGGGGGGGWGRMIVSCAVGWFLGGKFHSGREAQQLKSKHQKEQKALYSQYYNDVYKLTEQNTELQYVIEQLKDSLRQTEAKHELEAMQRDYDEFKQPDVDGDDKISRAEFNMYVKNYLSTYPGLSEKDYPKFEDFDHDNDGYVSFHEYSQQMALQAQQAELEQLYGKSGDNKKAEALKNLYSESTKKGKKF